MKYSALVILVLAGCGADDSEPSEPEDGASVDPGALVHVSMESRVGVVLDEIPEALRDALATSYLDEDEDFWRDRATAQILHTTYRLVFRNYYYDDKGMLALPPLEVWNIELDDEGAVRQNYQGHDAVLVGYRLETTLLSDLGSPGEAEPQLAEVGGVWGEPFNLPLDPEFLFQRTGYACMDEEGYPLGTADSENAWQLFDQDCDVETANNAVCHVSDLPAESCLDALESKIGRVDTELRFERVAWDADLADAVRVADYASTEGPDLEVIGDGLLNNRIVWRYFYPDSCALDEQCVGGPGWRRLLEFDASVLNASTEALTIGEAAAGPFIDHNNFIYSPCHEHYHYSHYGAFSYGASPGYKRAFCVESTDRYFNSEDTPLVHPYSCEYQGVASGWGDTYIAGVECNWIDITDLDIPPGGTRVDLDFQLNPDQFICEGTPVLDSDDNPMFEKTDITGENGLPVDRPLCEFVADHDGNNFEARPVDVPADGGMITSACTRKQAGPLRDCGWDEGQENLTCEPGETITLSCSTDPSAPPVALRICEGSLQQDGVIPCMYSDALATTVVEQATTEVSFICPAPRGKDEPGGRYGWFVAGLLPGEPPPPLTCETIL